MQTKAEFRDFLKSKRTHAFCMRDTIVMQKIFSLIATYKRPKAYKYYRHNRLSYYQNIKPFYNILLYNALESEVKTHTIIASLLRNKKYQVFIPKVEKVSFKMVKYRLPLVKNKFNIKESLCSKNSYNVIVDIAVIPVLGVDKNLKRIGFGKGMYDKFYATLRIKPYNIFVSRVSHISEFALCDWYDIMADIYVSSYP